MPQVQIGFELVNLEHVLKNLDELRYIATKSPVRQALRRAGRHLVSQGKISLKSLTKGQGRQTGKLRQSMSSILAKRSPLSLAGFKAGGRHAHLVDRGTVKRATRAGKNRGVMPANYFWTRTQLQESRAVLQIIEQGLEEAVKTIGE